MVALRSSSKRSSPMIQVSGDLERLRHGVQAVEPLTNPPTEAARPGLGQPGVV